MKTKLKHNCDDFSKVVAETGMYEDSRIALYQCVLCKTVWSVQEFRTGPGKYKISKKEDEITDET